MWPPSRSVRSLVLVGIVSLLAIQGDAQAGGPPYGIPSGVLPWEYRDYLQSREQQECIPWCPPEPPMAQAMPTHSQLVITRSTSPHKAKDPNVALVLVRLPEGATCSFQEGPAQSLGSERWFETPSLTPGKLYLYNVRVVWHENGQWVSQTERLQVSAGGVYSLAITKTN